MDHLCVSLYAAGPHKSPIILTYDQLIENAGISGDLLNKECSDKHLWKIASLLPDWVIFAKALGLTEPQIQDILQKQHLTTNKMRALEALEKWHRQHAYNATYCHLIKLCLTLELASIARDICEIVKGEKQIFCAAHRLCIAYRSRCLI